MDELDALWAFLVAAALAFGATPPVAALARRLGAVHQPRERDLHDKPVPRLGGLAILVAVVVAGVLFLPDERSTRAILIGAVAIALVGAWDDYLPGGLPPLVKLAGQFGAAAIPVVAGDVRVENVTLPFIEPFQLGDFGSYTLSLVGIVAVMNVVNFTDGADGLAAGVCTIAAATFAVIALSLNRDDAAVLAAVTAGSVAGLPLAQLPPRVDLHGRRRLEPARAAARLRRDRGVAEDGRRGRAVLPARDPRRAGGRRHLRGAQADQVQAAGLPGGRLALPPPACRASASHSGARCSTCTAGPCPCRHSRSPCASSRTRTTTARSTPGGRS